MIKEWEFESYCRIGAGVIYLYFNSSSKNSIKRPDFKMSDEVFDKFNSFKTLSDFCNFFNAQSEFFLNKNADIQSVPYDAKGFPEYYPQYLFRVSSKGVFIDDSIHKEVEERRNGGISPIFLRVDEKKVVYFIKAEYLPIFRFKNL